MKKRTLLGLPVVEVDDVPEYEVRLGPGLEVYPLRVTAVPGPPGKAMRFRMEVRLRPGLHTMEEMRDG
ncbi:hypothetical protein LCGC14_1494960 [marine sediment metagenome]|uniref:Uncharacterized protein n=1 Tax=marine sediment metagenome TaxID=412755 RepID=A0A0F9M793_9ZZZZ